MKLLILLISIFLFSCVSHNVDSNDFKKVTFETSYRQAIRVIGTPLSGGTDEKRNFESLIWQDNVHGCKTSMRLTWMKWKLNTITLWSDYSEDKVWQTVELMTESKRLSWIRRGKTFQYKHENITLEITDSYFTLTKTGDKNGLP